MRYFTQTQAPSGNWIDVLGTDNQADAEAFMRYQFEQQGKNARVVKRVDLEVCRVVRG